MTDAFVRTLAHALLEATCVSGVLVVVAAACTRVRGVPPGIRSAWWSAVAVLPAVWVVLAALAPWLPSAAWAPSTIAASAPAAIANADPLDRVFRTGENAPALAAPAVPAHAAPAAAQDARTMSWLGVVLAVWAIVAGALIARVFAGIVAAQRLRCGGRRLVHAALDDDVARARAVVRVRDDVATAMAIGIAGRTVVVASRLVDELPANDLRAVVLHEIAHLRRRDDWTHAIERVAAALLWFDPVVLAACRAAMRARELACDASAARDGGDAAGFARALYRCARTVAPAYGVPALHAGDLVERVRALVQPAPVAPRRALAASAALAIVAPLAFGLGALRGVALASPLHGLAPTSAMHVARASFASVRLDDGRVLIAGGMLRNHAWLSDAEVYDARRDTFDPTGPMIVARSSPAAALLPDGRVLIAGGWAATGPTARSEVYDPARGQFVETGSMHVARAGHTATPLPDGTVLIAGGSRDEAAVEASAEIYDPHTGRFTPTGAMHEARVAHTATAIADGRVLIAGGQGDGRDSLRSTEIYDAAARAFERGPAMREPRSKHAATLLADGSVLVTGGSSTYDWSARLSDTERYVPGSNAFVPAAPMHAVRFKHAGDTVRLANGDVLVAGGDAHAEVYDARHDRFSVVPGTLGSARNLGAAVLLDDGSVLIAGGYDSVNPLPTTPTALRFRP